MGLKILHSADWQIGQKASHVASVAEAVRKARLDAAREAIAAANQQGVAAVVLAGDQFEDNLVEDRLVHAVVGILAASRAPVYVLPGNHDALTHDSVYRRASWRSAPAHVHLIETFDPILVPGTEGVLLPAPVFQKKSAQDPTAGMRMPEGTRAIRIGIAHGSLCIEGKYSEDDFPIALEARERLGLDYLALGHWHGHFVHDGRTAYSGTQETCNFGEKGSGQALLVTLDSPGAPPEITKVRTGQLSWITCELDFDLGAEAALQLLRKRLEEVEDPARTLLRLRTSGHSGPEVPCALPRLEEELAARFLYFTLERGDTASAELDGKLAELADGYPIVEGLLEAIAARGLPREETGAAMQLLFECLSFESLSGKAS